MAATASPQNVGYDMHAFRPISIHIGLTCIEKGRFVYTLSPIANAPVRTGNHDTQDGIASFAHYGS